jgi:type IV pilus assembly protein PilB
MVDLAAIRIDPKVLALVPKRTALELSALPLSVDNDVVIVALPENHDREILNDLVFLIGKKVRVEQVPSEDLSSAIQRAYGISDVEFRKANVSSAPEFLSVREEAGEDTIKVSKAESSSDGSTITLANRIISDAIQMHASDIHVEPYERSLRVRYRLDGVLHDVLHPPFDKAKPLISRLKIMADLDIAEKRRPQDGRIRVKEGERVIDIRVSTLPTDFGEKVVLRILDKSQLELDLSKLGFEKKDLELFKKTIRLPFGMILVTGPTGSGKSTTLYGALNYINKPEINITTIEDPIEYNLAGINQTHVRSDIGLTFAVALRSILRQDPNVIMIGEIRDAETAEIAIRAALTGHLVFSTLHTNDAPSAVTRLIDMGIEPFLVASSLKMIIAQRLLRKLCASCKSPVKASAEEETELKIDSHGGCRDATGCPECNMMGYRGRTAVYEIMPINNGLTDLIGRGVTSSDLRKVAQADGMVSLREAAMNKCERGETSIDEVIRETSV